MPGALPEVLIPQGQSEVSKRRAPGSVEQEVRRLDVAVEHVVTVGIMQCIADDGDQLGGLGISEPSTTKPGRQIATFHILGHNIISLILGTSHIIDRHDVGMGEAGDDAGFVEVRLDVHESGRMEMARYFDGDVPVELSVVGQVDSPEPPFAEDPDHPVSTDTGRRASGPVPAVTPRRTSGAGAAHCVSRGAGTFFGTATTSASECFMKA